MGQGHSALAPGLVTKGSPPPGHDNIPSWDVAHGALDQAQMGAARQKFLFLPAETRLKILAHQVTGLPGGLWELLSLHERDQALHYPHRSQPCYLHLV